MLSLLKKVNSVKGKTTMSLVLGALVVYLQGRGLIAGDTAMLISSVALAFGFSINIAGYVKK